MTIGIYKLVFEGTDKVYIGQSICIEKRFNNHLCELRKGTSSKKLQEAYANFGTPKLEILSSCLLEELDTFEVETIDIYNSIENGFNLMLGGFSSYGENSSGAKYSNNQYHKILELLVNTSLSNLDIANMTYTSESVVRHISDLSRHHWLSSVYPEEYAELVKLRSIGTKRCAISRGIIYPPIISPEGVEYTVLNATSFAKEHGLLSGPLCSVLNGKTKTHKGWHLTSTTLEELPNVKSPEGKIYSIPFRGTKPFAIEHGLHPSDFARLLRGKIKQCKGWTRA